MFNSVEQIFGFELMVADRGFRHPQLILAPIIPPPADGQRSLHSDNQDG
jgi:hypothetical protein